MRCGLSSISAPLMSFDLRSTPLHVPMHLAAKPSVDVDYRLLAMAPTVAVDLPHLVVDAASSLLKIHLDLLAMYARCVAK
jgi:hypothetical protein